MTQAFVKFNVEPGQEERVRDSLKGISNVESADIVTGSEDIIARVKGENSEELLKLVTSQLRTVKGVTRTWTDLVIE